MLPMPVNSMRSLWLLPKRPCICALCSRRSNVRPVLLSVVSWMFSQWILPGKYWKFQTETVGLDDADGASYRISRALFIINVLLLDSRWCWWCVMSDQSRIICYKHLIGFYFRELTETPRHLVRKSDLQFECDKTVYETRKKQMH